MVKINTGTRHQKLWDILDQERITDQESIERSFARHLEYTVGKYKTNFTQADVYQALAYTVRDLLLDRFNATQEHYKAVKTKRVYYLSMEFLLGRLLKNNLSNLGNWDITHDALKELGINLDDVEEYEPDAGLGNGGLGRLAACFLDSIATLNLPGTGAGLRYEFGIFHQHIVDGYQKEAPDAWLTRGNPWEIMRPDVTYPIHFYGHTEQYMTAMGTTAVNWIPGETIMAMAHDILVPGHDTKTVNNLRLWGARASSEFNFEYFSHGDYIAAVQDKVFSESISKVLYPNENVLQGKELRLKQEYMLVSATIQDALKTFTNEDGDWNNLPERVFFQLNDTHPALAVAELMHIMVDQENLEWNDAWSITNRCLAYTNHTVMPEALETWDLDMFKNLLPRHLEIIYQINFLFLDSLRHKKITEEKIERLSIIQEFPRKAVRMANLAIVGSSYVNGVAALHTELIKSKIFSEFYELWPEKFQNKTNGITHRRWIMNSNRSLTELINSKIGTKWHHDLNQLRDLEQFSDNQEFQNDWEKVKHKNKENLARLIQFECGTSVNPDSIFDVQVKRIHEYKRQLLNVLRIVGDFQKIKANPSMDYTPRTVIFAGKAAPGYYMAKLVIKLIHNVGERINNDSDVAGRLKVVFLPNYSVSLGEKIFPASDLSEQISTAGTEASGTGNMKFMLNGALTVGTLDGANIEIMEEVGRENIYIFGNTVEQIHALAEGGYNPAQIYRRNAEIKRILDTIRGNYFSPGHPDLFVDIYKTLTERGDYYFHLADFPLYAEIQDIIGADFNNRFEWNKKSILNTARSGKFSTDRTISQYAKEIWHVEPVKA